MKKAFALISLLAREASTQSSRRIVHQPQIDGHRPPEKEKPGLVGPGESVDFKRLMSDVLGNDVSDELAFTVTVLRSISVAKNNITNFANPRKSVKWIS